MSTQTVPHFTETFAICIQSDIGGSKLVFGADSRPTDDLIEFARDCDLFLVEATLPRPERSGERGHMTPREAGVVSPYHRAVLAALRELTGRDTAPTQQAWRKLLEL